MGFHSSAVIGILFRRNSNDSSGRRDPDHSLLDQRDQLCEGGGGGGGGGGGCYQDRASNEINGWTKKSSANWCQVSHSLSAAVAKETNGPEMPTGNNSHQCRPCILQLTL